jgi:phage/plasmid-like protein (TIGR03299 family)
MAHGITEVDKGYVHGTTWHGLEQYVQQDHAVSPDQAVEVLDFPLEKRPLYRLDVNGNMVEAKAWEIIRPDHDLALAHHVGKDFTVMSNKALFDYINDNVLSEFPDISIESVGTLWSGKIAFVNLNVGEFGIDGDESKSVSRLMYYNPLGLGKYKVCAHNVRVVCNNTLRMATSEAITNGLLRMVSHTKNAEQNIKGALSEILAIRQNFLDMKEALEELNRMDVNAARMGEFFDKWLPQTEEDKKSQNKDTRRSNLITGITNQFEGDDSIKGRSMYGLLNAVTYWYDHEIPSRGNDTASIAWDGIVGGRSEKKVSALSTMIGMMPGMVV